MTDSPDNLPAAIDTVGTNLGRRKKISGTSDDIQQVLIRATKESHERWKHAAEQRGISMSEFVRAAADTEAAQILDCEHAAAHRRWYPWSEVCLRCGTELRNEQGWLLDPTTFPLVRPLDGNSALWVRTPHDTINPG